MKKRIIAIILSTLIASIFVAAVPTQARCWINCEDEEEVTSFSGFEGGLTAPTKEGGLDSTLTRADNATEFVVNTVNFVLGFLGLLAIVVVIYGGFLYVSAAGEEDQTTKGKKAITYAAIGIVIIIGSYAFVNTILDVGNPQGVVNENGNNGQDGQDGENGSDGEDGRNGRDGQDGQNGIDGQNGRNEADDAREIAALGLPGRSASNARQRGLYNFGAIQLDNSLSDFVRAYKNLVALKSALTQLRQLNEVNRPRSGRDNRDYITQVSNIIRDIKNKTGSLSKTNRVAKKLIDEFLYKYNGMPNDELAAVGYNVDDKIEGENLADLVEAQLKLTEENLINSELNKAVEADFTDVIDDLIGKKGTKIDENKSKLGLIRNILGGLAESSNGASTIDRSQMSLSDYQKIFEGVDPQSTVAELFASTVASLDAARELAKTPDETDLFKDSVDQMNRLYFVIRDIQFVTVKIKPSVNSGNAPLVVELNGLESRDPTGKTIPDENYAWDPDGDGENGTISSTGVSCVPTTSVGSTITCTYQNTGTYMVRLRVPSQDPTRVAAGEALIPITVKPSVAHITLKATVGPHEEILRSYEPDGEGKSRLAINKNELQITRDEGKVSFDASESRGQNDSTLARFKWTFGDGSQPIENDKAEHLYKNIGRYPLRLEVTDTGGRTDRKIVDVVVGSIAARIGVGKTVSEPGALLEFDGGLSRSDKGQITTYAWKITNNETKREVTNLANEVELAGNTNSRTLRARFLKPGAYSIELKVSDATGNEGTFVLDPLLIKSRKPRAQLFVRSCPENCPDNQKPGVVEFDASRTFDPDQGDEVSYDWHFYTDAGEELTHPAPINIISPTGNDITFPNKRANKLRVQFNKVGNYKVSLTVRDNHTEGLQQDDTIDKEFRITSIVEGSWDANLKNSAKLGGPENNAELTFSGKAKNATSVEINFGDGEDDRVDFDPAATGEQPFTLNHTYTEAGTYRVTAKITSDDNGEATLIKRVAIGSGDGPMAVIGAKFDGTDAPLLVPETANDSEVVFVEVLRGQKIKFDAGDSLDARGGSDLTYSWDFGDGDRSTAKSPTHAYKELSPEDGITNVSLSVTDASSEISPTNVVTFPIKVVSKKPVATTLTIEKKSAGNTTPVEVNVKAEGAVDPDGRIRGYQFWYFDQGDPEKKLGVIDTTSDHALITLETNGDEGQEHEYAFCAKITDAENMTSECSELFDADFLPKITVKNGANKTPVVSFVADRTNIRVGEGVTLSATASDADGRVAEYLWDFDGDGFQNDNPTDEATVTHIFDRKSPRTGFRVKLKVIDDKGASGFAQEVAIIVASKSENPVVNFETFVLPGSPRTVKFTDTSTPDTVNGARLTGWQWDFDTSTELNCGAEVNPKPATCNGDKADDIDSTDQNPIFEFAHSERYQVKLTVTDSDGNTASRTQFVTPLAGAAGGTDQAAVAVRTNLQANLTARAGDMRPRFRQIPGCVPAPGGAQRNDCAVKVLEFSADTCGSETVDFFWGDTVGEIAPDAYKLDTNIYFDASPRFPGDSEGNRADGNRGNDEENTADGTCVPSSTGLRTEKCFTRTYNRSDRTGNPPGPGNFRARLTVTNLNGDTSNDFIDVIFAPPSQACRAELLRGAGSLFKDMGVKYTILFSLIGGFVLVAGGFAVAGVLRKGKTRV